MTEVLEKREVGRTGSRKKPLEQKVLEGNRARANLEPLIKKEKKISRANAGGVPKPPKDFDEVAIEKWHFLFTELQFILKKIDLDALRIYCRTWSDYEKVCLIIQEEGFTVTGSTGSIVKNPHMTVQSDLINKLDKYGTKLGLDPSSRQKIFQGMGDDEDETDPMAELLNGSGNTSN